MAGSGRIKKHPRACRSRSGMNPSSPALPGCFRRALVQDAAALATLAFRSKAIWGYDPAFLERARPALSPSRAYLEHRPVYLLESAGQLIGFYGFDFEQGQAFLQDLFIAPEFVGRGYGRRLWAHLLGTAHREGIQSFLILSDPHAKGFYLQMGAQRVGERVAPETGRRLPLLRVNCLAPPAA
jgi:GNAT superfamily N-acetyltransferase